MTRITMAAALALAIISLAGCGSSVMTQSDYDHAWQVCGSQFDAHVRDQCLQNQYRLHAARQQDANDNAAILLLGGTAFMNGYNAGGDHPLPMTNYGGNVMMWSGQSGMLQGY